MKHLSSTTEKLDSEVIAFLSKPQEETIHDVRTSTRRVQALAELLPKSIRKKSKVTVYLARARALFKATTPIRDIDIVQSRLKKFEQNPGIKQLLEQKRKARERLLKTAYKAAYSLKNTGVPRFKSSQITQSKLLKRKKKLLRKYQSVLEKQMKILLSNPSVEQLHDFRKNCKMLRYTLELDSRKRDPLLAQLVKMQGALGVVMDVQATLGALSALPASEAFGTIMAELNAEKEKANGDYLAIELKFASSLAKLSPKSN